MKRFFLFLLAIVNGVSIFGQKETLSISFSANLTPPFSIVSVSRPDVALSSDPSMGYEGSLAYSRPLSDRINIELGVYGGVQSCNFTLFFRDSFIDYSSSQDYFLEKVSEYDLEYYGANLGLRYRLFQFGQNSIGLLAGVNLVYFLNQGHGFYYGAILPNGQEKEFFYAQSDINPDKNVIIAPNLGVYYSYHLNERIELGVKLNGVVSNKPIMKNYPEEPYYKIYGDNETVTGTWEKRFRQVGIGLSVFYAL